MLTPSRWSIPAIAVDPELYKPSTAIRLTEPSVAITSLTCATGCRNLGETRHPRNARAEIALDFEQPRVRNSFILSTEAAGAAGDRTASFALGVAP